MRFWTTQALAGGLLAGSVSALPQHHSAKNFIFVVPDGHGSVHQTLARDYLSMTKPGADIDNPEIEELTVDELTLGKVRTHSADNLVTDSAAAGTALGSGVKTQNDVVGIDEDGNIAGNILEAAHLAGYRTGLVVTSYINHATPASFSAHTEDRNNYDEIAAQQIGYSHPLGSVVDLMMGGGRCFFKPMSDPTSCREDDLDLFGFAESEGWNVMQDKAGFDALHGGKNASLPYIGLFNDDHLMYEIDRQNHPEQEPSLQAMVETALNSLETATAGSEKGYFIMVEASRIDHGSHANDPVATNFDAIEYNAVIDYIREYIDKHPRTVMMGAADHECGGMSLIPGVNPTPVEGASASAEYVAELYSDYNGSDHRAYLIDTLLPLYGLNGTNVTIVDGLLEAEDLAGEISLMLSDEAGISWGTDGHSAVDVDLIGYGAGALGEALKLDMIGGFDNTELVDYVAKTLGVNVSDATDALVAASSNSTARRV